MRSSLRLVTLALLVLSFFALWGCGGGGGGGSGSPATSSGAHLHFSAAGDIPSHATIRLATSLAVSSSADFEEGSLKSTRTYLFVLKNTGTTAAHDIVLTSDSPSVHLSPATIGILQPEGSGGVAPVIQVTVEHGVSADGVGYAPTLAAGRLQFNITATSTEVTASASVGMNVQVAAFAATFHGAAFDLDNDLTGTLNGVVPGASVDFYSYSEYVGSSPADRTLGITNTGNVPLTITTYVTPSSGSVLLQSEVQTIAPGASGSFNAESGGSWDMQLRFKVDSAGTEFANPGTPHAQPDGAWWAAFQTGLAPSA